ncbi:glycosyl transferase family group 2-domain-containing protein [Plectosphaerella cucumerina]|uniref:Glycosyl transferase family group 2-domain-containing protein n=1 Tax=Plectosphaerella cucumerina TaxID=40658 RepID=A0A8K0TGZ9_9PEZI|nr:glycosyl transferase family group 2-domain-containing protein [Plectosphaerella cucumerina]
MEGEKNRLSPGEIQEIVQITPRQSQRASTSDNSIQSLGMQSVQISTPSGAGRQSLMPGQSAFSRPVSVHGSSNSRHSRASMALRTDVIAEGIWQEQLRRQWASYSPFEGIVIKKSRGDFVCAPAIIRNHRDSLFDMVTQLNVTAALTLRTSTVESIIRALSSTGEVSYMPFADGRKLQVLPRLLDLPKCHKHHFAAFIIEPPLLVVWEDDAKKILARAAKLEDDIIKNIWGDNDGFDEDEDEKGPPEVSVDELDPTQLESAQENRPTRLTSSIMVGLTLALSIACLGLGWRLLAMQTTVDGDYTRLALVAVAPLTIFISLFFFLSIITDIFQVAGPVSSILQNSKNYSGKPPVRLNRAAGDLPHVTIQMPVYKEGLGPVIKPTVLSLKAAISTYEMQGGTANIFVNDDGMQLIPEKDADARREFYEEHSIGWVARPRNNPDAQAPEVPFIRRGRFKKASNMNYGLRFSNRIEQRLAEVHRPAGWNQDAESAAYTRAMREAGGNVRIGDYILLIDSDTRVPADCLLDAVSEMDHVTWFTNLIYTAITFSVAQGDIPPFVGHNAVLRWSAIQDAASYECKDDGFEKFWSESHVSEDFDMALRLQTSGYSLRFAAYTKGGFKEGVSLTVYDELARWEKYAYGVNELIFHPFRFWVVRGPFTPLFRRFIFSDIKFFRKITILGYIGTYYAIGISWVLSLANYFLTGWIFPVLDQYYLDSFAVYFSIIIVFPLAGNFALAVLRYRIGEQSFLRALINNFKWVPLFSIFLGGLSLHISKALLCHFFELDIQWGATSKEVERCNFLEEIPKIAKSFWGTFLYCFIMTALMICGYFVFPRDWRITDFVSIYPLAAVTASHFALPVLLNPALMKFTF